MKKTRTSNLGAVLSAAFALLSVISCNKDTTNEVIAPVATDSTGVHDVSSVILTSQISAPGNPIVTGVFTADPTAFVDNAKVYIYAGHDLSSPGTTGFVMNDWRLFSSNNMKNWTDEGSPLSYSTFSWAKGNAWASHIVKRNGKYYFYASVDHKTVAGMGIGVAVSNSAKGPFTDARGSALIVNTMTTQNNSWFDDIDPVVFVDDDGQAYIYWGNTYLKYAKLASNMTDLASGISVVNTNFFTEAPWVHKRNGIYYLSYASGWPESIVYATSSSPNGPWAFKGTIMGPNYNCNTNHPAIVDFNGQAYFIYHTSALPTGADNRRSVSVEALYYNADGTIRPIQQTSTGVNGTMKRVQSFSYPDRYIRHINFGTSLDANVSPAIDSQWKIIPGLANQGAEYVSFEAVSFPGYYLRHSAFVFQLAKNDGSGAFKSDATFKTVSGLADKNALSFQSYNFTDRYIRHQNFALRIDPISTTQEKQDATFKIAD